MRNQLSEPRVRFEVGNFQTDRYNARGISRARTHTHTRLQMHIIFILLRSTSGVRVGDVPFACDIQRGQTRLVKTLYYTFMRALHSYEQNLQSAIYPPFAFRYCSRNATRCHTASYTHFVKMKKKKGENKQTS